MFFLKFLPTQSLILNYQEHFPEGSEPIISEKLEKLREASLLLRALEDYFRGHDSSLTRFLILVILDRSDVLGGLSHTQITDRIDVSAPVISRSLKTMIESGLIESAPASKAHTKPYRLTETGREQLQNLLPGYYETLISVPN